jgi:hypothetical protein
VKLSQKSQQKAILLSLYHKLYQLPQYRYEYEVLTLILFFTKFSRSRNKVPIVYFNSEICMRIMHPGIVSFNCTLYTADCSRSRTLCAVLSNKSGGIPKSLSSLSRCIFNWYLSPLDSSLFPHTKAHPVTNFTVIFHCDFDLHTQEMILAETLSINRRYNVHEIQ